MYFDENDFAETDHHVSNLDPDTSCPCDHCGEEIEVQVDFSQGASQEFVEDCPVC